VTASVTVLGGSTRSTEDLVAQLQSSMQELHRLSEDLLTSTQVFKLRVLQ
jgi:hypothetical protein